MIGIIDYRMGNLTSVLRAFQSLRVPARIVAGPDEPTRDVDGWVLPGVGAFPQGMENLRRLGWAERLAGEVGAERKPVLGICLGMQLMCDAGHEFARTDGLGWIAGETRRLPEQGVALPHIGWNNVRHSGARLYAGVPQDADFYFVHSYAFYPKDPARISGTCEYGSVFAASVESDRVYGVQFHPEKSGRWGLKLLTNFAGSVSCSKKD